MIGTSPNLNGYPRLMRFIKVAETNPREFVFVISRTVTMLKMFFLML